MNIVEERGVIQLSKPIMINGENVTKMKYDVEEITPSLYAQAEVYKMKAGNVKAGNMAGAVEIDYSLHMYIGFAAVIAVNPSYTFEDLERITGKSLKEFSRVGRSFFIGSDDSEDDSSDEQSETSQEPITPAQQKLSAKE